MKLVLTITWSLIQWTLVKLLTGLLYILTKGSVRVVEMSAKGALKVAGYKTTRVGR